MGSVWNWIYRKRQTAANESYGNLVGDHARCRPNGRPGGSLSMSVAHMVALIAVRGSTRKRGVDTGYIDRRDKVN